ncbi:hypothetical protein D9Q98_002996 [Chlorella vulgaris]|uniref:Uncharacterized protein n=1 Tax=Chlorella vulgaris TaxID=3077 RepID=A0A9D4TUG3_CHLVU|nr:hypothetical protein D9Q98_002996 [Chlorella vulgaris]
MLAAQHTQQQQLGLPQKLSPVASVGASAARQAAGEAAQAAAAAALPPSLIFASLSGKVLHVGPLAHESASEAGSSEGKHVLPSRQLGQQAPEHEKQAAQQEAAVHQASGDEHAPA